MKQGTGAGHGRRELSLGAMNGIRLLALVFCVLLLGGCVTRLPVTTAATGHVYSSVSKEPLAKVQVSIKDSPKITTLSGKDGSFDLPSKKAWLILVAPTDHFFNDSLVVEKEGYVTTVLALDRMPKVKDLRIYLVPEKK